MDTRSELAPEAPAQICLSQCVAEYIDGGYLEDGEDTDRLTPDPAEVMAYWAPVKAHSMKLVIVASHPYPDAPSGVAFHHSRYTKSLRNMFKVMDMWRMNSDSKSVEWWFLMRDRGMLAINATPMVPQRVLLRELTAVRRRIAAHVAKYIMYVSRSDALIVFVGAGSAGLMRLVNKLLIDRTATHKPTVCTCPQPAAHIHWRPPAALAIVMSQMTRVSMLKLTRATRCGLDSPAHRRAYGHKSVRLNPTVRPLGWRCIAAGKPGIFWSTRGCAKLASETA